MPRVFLIVRQRCSRSDDVSTADNEHVTAVTTDDEWAESSDVIIQRQLTTMSDYTGNDVIAVGAQRDGISPLPSNWTSADTGRSTANGSSGSPEVVENVWNDGRVSSTSRSRRHDVTPDEFNFRRDACVRESAQYFVNRKYSLRDETNDDTRLTTTAAAGNDVETTTQRCVAMTTMSVPLPWRPACDVRRRLKQVENRLGDYVCRLCAERFPDAVELARHGCPGLESDSVRCPVCAKSFHSPANLASHRRWHRPQQTIKSVAVVMRR